MTERVKGSYDQQRREFDKASRKIQDRSAGLVSQWERLADARQRELEIALLGEGLAVCSMAYEHVLSALRTKGKRTGEIDLTNEELGVFPKHKLKYIYEEEHTEDFHQDMFGHVDVETKLKLLCPEHYPTVPEANLEPHFRWGIVRRKVIEKDGRLVIPGRGVLFPDRDVTEYPLEGHEIGYDEGLYRNFGIAPLPPQPVESAEPKR